MSRTYRRTNTDHWSTKGKINSVLYKMKDMNMDEYRAALNKIDWLKHNYKKSPSHWNHDYSTVPRRAKERKLLKKIQQEYYDYDDVLFPDGKKPIIYYW